MAPKFDKEVEETGKFYESPGLTTELGNARAIEYKQVDISYVTGEMVSEKKVYYDCEEYASLRKRMRES